MMRNTRESMYGLVPLPGPCPRPDGVYVQGRQGKGESLVSRAGLRVDVVLVSERESSETPRAMRMSDARLCCISVSETSTLEKPGEKKGFLFLPFSLSVFSLALVVTGMRLVPYHWPCPSLRANPSPAGMATHMCKYIQIYTYLGTDKHAQRA